MPPKSLPLLLLALTLLITPTHPSPQVHDISHSQLQVVPQPHSQQVILTPQRSVFAHWEFPDTWDISQLLAQSLDSEIALPNLSNIEASIAFVKDKVSHFLKLTDKAELLAKNIKELPNMKNDPYLNVQEDQFKVLEQHESTLSALNQQIDSKALQLQKIIHQLMVKQQNPLFKQAALNFEKKALIKKISLYEQLSVAAASGKSKAENGQNDKRVADYFNELDHIFRVQSGLIDEIDTLLKSHNELTILKARVTSLTSQLKAHELTLAEKEQCAKQFQKIKEKQAHDKEVVKLVETLKLKKLQYSEPNKYCEGVVKKLIERVKRLLVGYDYVFECAQQLDEIRTNRDKIKTQLDEAQRKLDELQLSKGVETFRRNFENNREVIQKKVQQLKSLQLDDFYMYPETLHSAITSAKDRIAQIDDIIANLPVKSNLDFKQIQQRIKEKVGEIKVLKASYCKENEAYKSNSQIIENRLMKLEQQEEYNAWVKNVLVDKFEELERVKAEMRQLKKEITQHLQEQTAF